MPASNGPGKYYPAFVDLQDKKCVVVGGGRIAERKVRDLLSAGAEVRVISPELNSGLLKMTEGQRIRHSKRGFRPSDLRGAFLAIAATDDMKVNNKVAHEGRRMLVNVVDKPSLCSFIVPSVLRRGPLTIAVSTSGASPAMARAIRLELEGLFGKEVGQHLEKLRRMRERIIRDVEDPVERERKLKELGSPEALAGLLGKKASKKEGSRK